MERSAFTTKRKKRKTRKCLDEMRKRSKRSNEEISENHNNDNILKNTIPSRGSLVTMNRLTIAMFSKAVQSETITRPVLAEIKQKCNLDRSVENIALSSSTSDEVENDCNGDPNIPNDSIEIEVNCDNRENNKTSIMPPVESPAPSEMFSPTNNIVDKDLPIDISSSSSNLSQSSEECHFYEELTNELSDYFKKITEAVVHEDVIKKSKIHLQKLYIESCQKEYEKNIMNCIRSNILPKPQSSENAQSNMSNISIVDEPSIIRECPVSLSESSECELSPPALGISSSSSDKELFTCPPQATTSPELPLSDSPEYIYYPHRLN